MSKRLSILTMAVICTCIGCGIGYLVGASRAGIIFTEYVLDTNSNQLTGSILSLAKIRTGRADDVVPDMEMGLDRSIRQLSWPGLDRDGKFHSERVPATHLRALQAAKVYADAGYRNAFSEDSLRILDSVESVDVEDCAPALQELQEKTNI